MSGNNRIKKPKSEEINEKLEYVPGNADTIQIKLLEMINKNLGVLIREIRDGRQNKPTS